MSLIGDRHLKLMDQRLTDDPPGTSDDDSVLHAKVRLRLSDITERTHHPRNAPKKILTGMHKCTAQTHRRDDQ